MKSIIITTLCIVLMPLLAVSQKDQSITLSDISSSLEKFEGKDGYDYVGDSIKYKAVDKANYDGVFKESALINASIKQISGTVNKINDGSVSPTSPFAISSVKYAVKDLPDFDERIKSLQSQLKQLNPKSDFKGMQMKKAPKATSGMNMASDQLVESSKKLPSLLTDLKEVSAKVLSNE